MRSLNGWVLVLAAGCGAALAADPDVASRETWRVRVDTNAATVASAHVAARPGTLLAGKADGTNAVWVAVEAGTNGWVKIAQKP